MTEREPPDNLKNSSFELWRRILKPLKDVIDPPSRPRSHQNQPPSVDRPIRDNNLDGASPGLSAVTGPISQESTRTSGGERASGSSPTITDSNYAPGRGVSDSPESNSETRSSGNEGRDTSLEDNAANPYGGFGDTQNDSDRDGQLDKVGYEKAEEYDGRDDYGGTPSQTDTEVQGEESGIESDAEGGGDPSGDDSGDTGGDSE